MLLLENYVHVQALNLIIEEHKSWGGDYVKSVPEILIYRKHRYGKYIWILSTQYVICHIYEVQNLKIIVC